ncbi:hypothetical protein ACGFNX_06870 [Streptomyces sp. NPDC048723]|uniref:hypothetical protein n=1 Tax=unclassified Streptomyces TaxID=2593676 RepID=UPI000AFA41EA
MSESGVYRTTDEFLAEFVDPEDHAAVKAGAAKLAAQHEAKQKRRDLLRATLSGKKKAKVGKGRKTHREPLTPQSTRVSGRASQVLQDKVKAEKPKAPKLKKSA